MNWISDRFKTTKQGKDQSDPPKVEDFIFDGLIEITLKNLSLMLQMH